MKSGSRTASANLSKKDERVRFIASYLFIFFVSVFLLTSSDSNVTYTDASQARYEVTKAIIERYDLSIPSGLGIRGADGQDFSWYGIGQSILAIPFYVVGKYISNPAAVSIMNQLFGAAAAVLVFLFAVSLNYSLRASLLASVFYGLGTMAWPLAKQPFDHTIETFFILLAVYCMHGYIGNKKIFGLLCAAISFGVAFITRPVAALSVPALFVMLLVHYWRRTPLHTAIWATAKDGAVFSLGFLPFLLVSFWYNYLRFGSIFETGFSIIAARTGLHFFTGTPLLTGLTGYLISPGKGFFFYSPVAVLFLFSVRSFMKKHLELFLCFIAIIISYLLFLSKNIYWHGDCAWGPRYLLAVTPFFMIPVADFFDSHLWHRQLVIKIAICSLFLVSLMIQIAAVSVDFQKYQFYLFAEERVKFTVVRGDGVQPIVEPPGEVYFDWNRSPIASQFFFIYKMAKEMGQYRYSKIPAGATLLEQIKGGPHMNVFDFWWLYKSYAKGSTEGFYAATGLFIVASYAAIRLWKMRSEVF